MSIRNAEKRDLPELLRIIEEAKGTIAALGIDQWQKGYPNEDSLKEDVTLNRSYCVEREGVLCGTFVLMTDEPTYGCIDGEWLTGESRKYYALHRVAVPVSHRGKGIAEEMIAFASEKARKKNFSSIRIDTHEGNLPMRRMLEKNGFLLCGIITLANGDPRIAYEKII